MLVPMLLPHCGLVVLVCWRCVGGVLSGGVAPLWFGGLGWWCGGADVCVCCLGTGAPWRFGVLVVVWFGGWRCVVLVGWCLWRVAGGVHPLWFGVLMV